MKRRLGLVGVFLVGAAIRTSHAQFFDVQAHGLPSLDIHHCLTCVEGQAQGPSPEGLRLLQELEEARLARTGNPSSTTTSSSSSSPSSFVSPVALQQQQQQQQQQRRRLAVVEEGADEIKEEATPAYQNTPHQTKRKLVHIAAAESVMLQNALMWKVNREFEIAAETLEGYRASDKARKTPKAEKAGEGWMQKIARYIQKGKKLRGGDEGNSTSPTNTTTPPPPPPSNETPLPPPPSSPPPPRPPPRPPTSSPIIPPHAPPTPPPPPPSRPPSTPPPATPTKPKAINRYGGNAGQVSHPPPPSTSSSNSGVKKPPTPPSPPASLPPSTPPPKNEETLGSVGYELPHGFVPGVEAEVKIDIPNPMNMFQINK